MSLYYEQCMILIISSLNDTTYIFIRKKVILFHAGKDVISLAESIAMLLKRLHIIGELVPFGITEVARHW